jgi:PAS domain S-box-containing protein
VPTTKQFRQPYFMDIAPDGAVLSTCDRFATLLNKQNIPDFLGGNFLELFSRLGKVEPSIAPDLFRSGLTLDLFIQGPGIKPFVIRWIPAPRYATETNAEGWQLTGTKVDSETFLPPGQPESRRPSDTHIATDPEAAQKMLLDGKKSYLIMTIGKDITEIRLAEQQIPGILESITDGFFVLDTNFNVKLWNHEAERITCLSATKMIGQSIWETIPEWSDTNIGRSFHQAFKNKMTVTVEQYYERSSGWLEMSLYPFDQGMFAYFRDVTHRKKQDALLTLEKKVLELQLELNKQKLLARAMVDAQERERAEIGKELLDNVNQVLSTTKLYLELAGSDNKERLSLINRSAGNIHNAIREIRNISRSLVPASIGDLGLLDSLIDLVESIQQTRGIRVEFYPMGNFDERLSDKTKLMLFRIVQEQVNNVLKHSGARKLIIELILEEAENNIELSMIDDGKGFDPERVRKKGLGLSNIRSRADLFGGKVTIQSAPGRGCRLNVKVPVI